MDDNNDRCPVITFQKFLEEASYEFNRVRFETKLSLVGSLVLLVLLARFVVFISSTYWPWPLDVARQGSFILDLALLGAALASVITSVDVMLRQRKFISRWGERFEKLTTIESKLLSARAKPD